MLSEGMDKIPAWSPGADEDKWKHRSSKRAGQIEILKVLGYEE